MPVTPSMLNELDSLLNEPGTGVTLARFLIANSSLPGPRANLELIDALAMRSAKRSVLIPLFAEWLQRATPAADPAEFLSASAAVALGAIFPAARNSDRRIVVDLLKSAANDPRWRVREGVTMGLQRIGEADFADLEQILRGWMPTATLLEQRAIIAALAHPPILRDTHVAESALAICGEIAKRFAATSAADRKTDEFKTLKQGLSYAISVVVAATPECGFALLHDLVVIGDKDTTQVVKANLAKNRLAKPFPVEVSRLLAELTAR